MVVAVVIVRAAMGAMVNASAEIAVSAKIVRRDNPVS